MVAIPKKYTTIAVATVAIAAIAIALVYSQKKKSAYNALAASAAEGFTPRIIGGSVLDQGVWAESRRYLVAIKYIYEEDGAFRNLHNCGATLVSPQVVLTAAHCFTNLTTGSFVPGGTRIEFNRYSMEDDEGVGIIPLCLYEDKISCDELSLSVGTSLAYVIRHPDYDFNTHENDVTLIILPDDQQVTTIIPVTLNRDPDVPVVGEELEAFGWGQTCKNSDQKPASPFHECPDGTNLAEIQTGTLEHLTNQECHESLMNVPFPDPTTGDTGIAGELYPITDDKLCARTNRTDGFHGERRFRYVLFWSCGTLDRIESIAQLSHFLLWFSPAIQHVRRATSIRRSASRRGLKTGTDTSPVAPDVFARISTLYDWIQETVCAEVPSDEVFCVESTPSSPTTEAPPTTSSKSSKSPTKKPTESPTTSQPTVSPTKGAKARKY
ncbi:hypothetical protein ACHAXA_006301 [Cyclostephanos tholiformis]|uniref:Peptidase S1 domain-containing protein n=1 Tax=Cyclostephanos tholiformis TaxID=382380 RepID=A0ABD3R558_9STRA